MLLKEIENIENSINSLQTAPSEDAAISFACDYKDSGNGVKSFANYLMACSNEFQKSHNLFMSPYVAIVQSSMYGKTRLLREIARSYYRVVYVCLREEWSTGYPPRTLGAFTHLFVEPKKDAGSVQFSRILADRFKRLVLSALENLQDPIRPDVPTAMPKQESVLFPSDLIGDKLWNNELHKAWTGDCDVLYPKGESHSPQIVVSAIDEANTRSARSQMLTTDQFLGIFARWRIRGHENCGPIGNYFSADWSAIETSEPLYIGDGIRKHGYTS